MVADGHPLVVGEERVVGPEHRADVRGVEDGSVEVGVVADHRGQQHLRLGLGDEHVLGVAARRHEAALGAEQVAEPVPQRTAQARRQRHEARSGCAPRQRLHDLRRQAAEEPALVAGARGRGSGRRSRTPTRGAPPAACGRRRGAGSGWESRSPGSLADSTQLRSARSWVSSISCRGISGSRLAERLQVGHGLGERARAEREREVAPCRRERRASLRRGSRHARPSPSKTKASRSSSCSTASTRFDVDAPSPHERGRGEHVQEPVHVAPRAVVRVGQRRSDADRMVQAGRGLEGHPRRRRRRRGSGPGPPASGSASGVTPPVRTLARAPRRSSGGEERRQIGVDRHLDVGREAAEEQRRGPPRPPAGVAAFELDGVDHRPAAEALALQRSTARRSPSARVARPGAR